jgi:hypothetical protein
LVAESNRIRFQSAFTFGNENAAWQILYFNLLVKGMIIVVRAGLLS